MPSFNEIPIRPDVPDASESRVDCPGETAEWQDSVELPDDTGEWQDSIELPDDTGEWQDSIELLDVPGNISESDMPEEYQKMLSDFEEGLVDFDEAKEALATKYASLVNENRPWKWYEDIPGGDNLTLAQRAEIKAIAEEKKLIPYVPIVFDENGKRIALFRDVGLVITTIDLPQDMWDKSDAEQFAWLNEQIGGSQEGTTWHHSEIPGKMELIPFGIHNVTNHSGGRSAGMWADAPR